MVDEREPITIADVLDSTGIADLVSKLDRSIRSDRDRPSSCHPAMRGIFRRDVETMLQRGRLT